MDIQLEVYSTTQSVDLETKSNLQYWSGQDLQKEGGTRPQNVCPTPHLSPHQK